MSITTVPPVEFPPQLRPIDRLVALIAWGLAIALFFKVGWRALEPADPQGAVSMLTCRHPWPMVAQMAALGTVVAGLATLLIGRKLADAGAFATCLGLAVANLRADTLGSILISVADRGTGPGPNLAASFLVEALVWFGVVVLALVVSGLVFRWCFGRPPTSGVSALSAMAATELPMISALLRAEGDGRRVGERRTALWHLLFTAIVAFGLIGILATGSPAPPIEHGQVYFSITAAFCIAAYFAHGRFPVRTPLWSCLAVPLVSIAAYLWVTIVDSSKAAALPASIPHSAYLRALPLEYVTLGTLGSILAFWWRRHTYVAAQFPQESR
ncbi:MAG: hypothetical protein V2A79_18085 [Planctomycetota bacterium]